MECHNSSMFLSLLPTMLLCIIAALIVMRKVSQNRTSKLPPGPWGLPVIGHLHLLGKLPHQSLYKLSKIHGPLMSLRLGSVPAVVASSPEFAREILQTHDATFANRMPTAVVKNIFGEGRDMVFSQPNAYWKLMRRLCATELFSTKGLAFFKPVREEEVRSLVRLVLAEGVDAPVQMRPKLRGTTNNIIMRMMLGKRFSELGGTQGVQGSRKASMEELLGKIGELLGVFNVGDFLPWTAWMDLQGCEKRSKKLGADLRDAFEGSMHARDLAKPDGHQPNDFLDVLLQAAASSNTPIHLTEVLLNLFLGGTDTSSNIIEWALAELLSNPEKMRIAQAEIDEVVGRTRVIKE